MIGYKFGALTFEDGKEWIYPNVWATEQTSDGGSRLIIAPARNQIELLIRLMTVMPEPFGLLYVLLVPRGGSGEPGRYQSPDTQTRLQTEHFLTEFAAFLEGDGRHHLWIASTTSSARLIYDHHNVIYGYGPVQQWRSLLSDLGLTEASSVRFPSPHSHHYHLEMDAEERRMMEVFHWLYSPLRESDDQ